MNEDFSKKKIQPVNLENPSQKPRESKRKTAIMLSAITCLFMCIMGYELVRDQDKSQAQSAKDKKFSIIAQSKPNPLFNKQDQRQMALLNAQNQQLSEKIRQLKQQATDASQRMHALQLSLLTARKNSENTKMKEMSEALSAKETMNAELKNDIQVLESKVLEHENMIATMDDTIAHLTEMLEVQGKGKETLALALSANMDSLKNEAAAEKELLLRTIIELENNQNKLKKSVEAHAAEVRQLEDDVSKYTLLAMEKDQEIALLNMEKKEATSEIEQQIGDLALLIEVERMITHHTENDLQHLNEENIARGEQMQQLHNQVSAYEKLVLGLNADLESKSAALSKAAFTEDQLKSGEDQLKHMLEAKLAMIENMEKEMSSMKMELEATQATLATTVRNHAEEMEQEKTKASVIAHELEMMTAVKQQDIDGIAMNYADTQKELDYLRSELEIEKTRNIELVQNEAIAEAAMQHRIGELAANLSAREKEFEQALISKNSEALEILAAQKREMQQALDEAVAKWTAEQSRSLELENQMQELASVIQANEEKLGYVQMHAEITAADFFNQKLLLEEQKAALEASAAKFAAEQMRSQELEQQLGELTRLIKENEGAILARDQEHMAMHQEDMASLEQNHQELAQMRALYADAIAKKNELEGQLGELTSLIQMSEEKMGDVQMQAEITAADYQQKKEVIEMQKAALAQAAESFAAERAKNQELETQLGELTQLISNNQEILTQAELRIQSMQQENTSALASTQEELAESRMQYNAALEKSMQLEEQLGELAKLLRLNEEKISDLQLQAEVAAADYINQKGMLNEQRDALDAALAKYESEKQKAEEFQKQMGELTEIILAHQSELENMRLQSMHSTSELASRYEEQEKSLNQAFEQYNQEKNKSEELEHQMTELTQIILQHEDEIEKLYKQVRITTAMQSDFEAILAEAQAQYEAEKQRAAQLEQQISELNEMLKKHQQEIQMEEGSPHISTMDEAQEDIGIEMPQD